MRVTVLVSVRDFYVNNSCLVCKKSVWTHEPKSSIGSFVFFGLETEQQGWTKNNEHFKKLLLLYDKCLSTGPNLTGANNNTNTWQTVSCQQCENCVSINGLFLIIRTLCECVCGTSRQGGHVATYTNESECKLNQDDYLCTSFMSNLLSLSLNCHSTNQPMKGNSLFYLEYP